MVHVCGLVTGWLRAPVVLGWVPRAGGCTHGTEALAWPGRDGSLQTQPPAGGLGFVHGKLHLGPKGAPLLWPWMICTVIQGRFTSLFF